VLVARGDLLLLALCTREVQHEFGLRLNCSALRSAPVISPASGKRSMIQYCVFPVAAAHLPVRTLAAECPGDYSLRITGVITGSFVSSRLRTFFVEED
jgi:hypothetical protein